MEIKNTSDLITWNAFKEKLFQLPQLILQFCYTPGTWVNASYHITEIKQANITAVDCGGKLNTWTEIIVQLWEPVNKSTEKAMTVSKAMSIIKVVEKNLPLNPMGIVKIEFGNSGFDTRQLYPDQFIVDGEDLVINLSPDFTQCKAINRGDSCGTVAQSVSSCCIPGSGCC